MSALLKQYSCIGSTEPFLCHTAISTKLKCAGSFDLVLALNQAKLNILYIQRDDNHRDKHEGLPYVDRIITVKKRMNVRFFT